MSKSSEEGWRRDPDPGLEIGDLFAQLLVDRAGDRAAACAMARKTFDWPPDLFALCAVTIRRSGCYVTAPMRPRDDHGAMRPEFQLKDAAKHWRRRALMPADERPERPEEPLGGLYDDWIEIWSNLDRPVDLLRDDPQLVTAFFELLAAADHACAGVGLPRPLPPKEKRSKEDRESAQFFDLMMEYLTPGPYGSTLCKYIHPTRARVLPKVHMPITGVTIRSFSRYLSYCESDEVQPRWFLVPGTRGSVQEGERVNILVVPWPSSLQAAQLEKTRDHKDLRMRCAYPADPARPGHVDGSGPERTDDGRPGELRRHLFTYDTRDSGGRAADEVRALCLEAEKQVGALDAVVLPELALSFRDYEEVRQQVLARSLLLVCGVGRKATRDEPGDNSLYIDVPLSPFHAVHFRQSKHHPWRLDAGQITQYGLGGSLHSEDSYWEDININDRRLLFVVLRPWLVTCGLICEDLARHDPVGELMLNIAPHLVLALLMDGPQLRRRWPGRYATSLADDPGSSVLSVTSLGMSRMTEPRHGDKESRTVALWKDAQTGDARELELPRDASALVLSLTVRRTQAMTDDWRLFEDVDYPMLTGIHPVSLPNPVPPAPRTPDPLRLSPNHWLSPNHATALARLAQLDEEGTKYDEILASLDHEARLIGLALRWLRSGHVAEGTLSEDEHAEFPKMRHWRTAKEIKKWSESNHPPGLYS